MKAIQALISLIFISFVVADPSPKDADLVTELANMTTFDTYKLYSGMLPVGDTTKELHYVLVETQSGNDSDPLVLWFNGGPGCSSMLAFMQEHGPWVMDSGEETFKKNEYSWNTNANMLYIEMPAGVGFSYCNSTAESCDYNDTSSADQNLLALNAWFERFPEYKTKELYLSGESYSGIYVPNLLAVIDDYNNVTAQEDQIKVKGMMVGNGVTNWTYDTMPATVDMGYWHSIMSQDTHDSMIAQDCDYSGIVFDNNPSDSCMDLLNTFQTNIQYINIYNIYGKCYGGISGEEDDEFDFDEEEIIEPQDESTLQELGRRILESVSGEVQKKKMAKKVKKGYTAKDYTPWLFSSQNRAEAQPKVGSGLGDLPPCTFGIPLINWANNATVRKQLHIPDYVQEWTMCADQGPGFSYTINPIGSQWVWEKLYGKYRMLKFSGDQDAAVPTIGSINWINNMQKNWGKSPTEAYRPWFNGDQVAGYVEEWEGMTFLTVQAAGHMVPQDQRERAHYMMNTWVRGGTLNSTQYPLPSE